MKNIRKLSFFEDGDAVSKPLGFNALGQNCMWKTGVAFRLLPQFRPWVGARVASPQRSYSGSEGEMLRKGFPQSSRPCLVEKPAVAVVQPYIRLHRGQGAYRCESQSQTFDVRG